MSKYKLNEIAPIKQGNAPDESPCWLLNLDRVESNTGKIIEYLYVQNDEIGTSTVAFDTKNVLYSKLRPYLNKVVLPDRPGFATSEMLPLMPDTTIITREYLTYFLRSPRFVGYISEKTSGAKMPRANTADLKAAEIDCPAIEQQNIIVDMFERLTRIIQLRQRQLRALDTLIKARFVEMFGDTILNPFQWDKDLLGGVCDVRDGTHDSPQYYETGFPLVTSKNVTGGKIDLTNCSLICKADYEKINERSKVDMGDIIMPMIGTVGKPVIVDVEPLFAIKNVALIKFRANSRVLNSYVRALLQSDYFDDAVLSKVRGGTQKFISLGDIRKLEVLVPTMERQKQFATFVAQVEKSKVAIQAALEKVHLLFDSLMQQYFG